MARCKRKPGCSWNVDTTMIYTRWIPFFARPIRFKASCSLLMSHDMRSNAVVHLPALSVTWTEAAVSQQTCWPFAFGLIRRVSVPIITTWPSGATSAIRLRTCFRKGKTSSCLLVGEVQEKEEMVFPKALASMNAKMDELFRPFPCSLVRCYAAERGSRRSVTLTKAHAGSPIGNLHPFTRHPTVANPGRRSGLAEVIWSHCVTFH